MTSFVTKLDLSLSTLGLPDGSRINKVTVSRDNQSVDVYWECDNLTSPYSFNQEYSAAMLKDGKLPENVKNKKPVIKKPVDKPPKKGDKAVA